MDEIKQANEIKGSSFIQLFAVYSVLKIPHSIEPSAAQEKSEQGKRSSAGNQEILKQFCAAERCTAFEAKTYLEPTEYDLDKARAARREWLESDRPVEDTSAFKLNSASSGFHVASIPTKRVTLTFRNKLERISDDIYNL